MRVRRRRRSRENGDQRPGEVCSRRVPRPIRLQIQHQLIVIKTKLHGYHYYMIAS